jgi:hypothetical protein
MTTSVSKTIYRLRLLSDSGSDRDDVRHLKQLLKVLLRRFHFRCIEIMRESTP